MAIIQNGSPLFKGEAGAESSAIKNILGHSNIATTKRYIRKFRYIKN